MFLNYLVATIHQISFTFDEDVTGPMYVYYEIHKFYQNHRTYTKSRSAEQLMGDNLSYDDVYSDCYPIITNGSLLLNPCGLIANTFFNGKKINLLNLLKKFIFIFIFLFIFFHFFQISSLSIHPIVPSRWIQTG